MNIQMNVQMNPGARRWLATLPPSTNQSPVSQFPIHMNRKARNSFQEVVQMNVQMNPGVNQMNGLGSKLKSYSYSYVRTYVRV